jgi:hypothetical protein
VTSTEMLEMEIFRVSLMDTTATMRTRIVLSMRIIVNERESRPCTIFSN